MKVKILRDFKSYKKDQIINLRDDEAGELIKKEIARYVSWGEVARSNLAMPKFLNKIIKK